MKIAVVGAGGVGGFFGGKLAASGADVTFIARGETLTALLERGLEIESIAGDFGVPQVKATADPATIGPVDVVLVATKAWQLADAARSIVPIVGPDTVVVPLQNGIDAPEQLAAIVGQEHVAGGLCAIVAFVVSPGMIRHVGAEPFVAFGEMDNRRSPRLERLRDAFVKAGVKCEIPPDIHHSMWTKFVFIAPMSGLGGVTRVPVGSWRTVPETRMMAERAVREVIAVAAGAGVTLEPNMVDVTMGRYDGLPPAATSSLQRDVMEGKPSELDAQLGAVVRLGSRYGVATPLHDWMYSVLLPAENLARGR